MSTGLTHPPRTYTPPIPVDFSQNAWDRKVRALGKEGLYATTIAHHTGLTPGQVRYRLKLEGLGGNEYRRGESPRAKALLERVDRLLAQCRNLRTEFREGRHSVKKKRRNR